MKGMMCEMGKKDGRLGEFGVNNNGEEMRIVRYGNANDIDVQFVEDGSVVEHTRYKHFKTGSIKNPFFPAIYGIGYFGVGDFKSIDENGKINICYNTWKHMYERCYDPKYQEKQPTYKGCTVCKEWWNFQVFAKWFYINYYNVGNERMALDKDILYKGNKVYSPDTCVFVPQRINSLFIKCNKSRGECPIGVSKQYDKYVAWLSKGNGNPIRLGTYDTPEEAFLTYKKAKEEYIKEVAEEYKSQIPHELYEAMINYEVNIDD